MKTTSSSNAANTDPRFFSSLTAMLAQDGLNKNLYDDFKNLILRGYNLPVPGLKRTTIDGVTTTQMVPQGVCFTGTYFLLTSHAEKQPTVYASLTVLQKNGAYMKTIGIKMNIHAGGIAYHESSGYIWIACNTDTDTSGAAKVMRVHLNTILNKGEGTSLQTSEYKVYTLSGIDRASYITIYGNSLCIGLFNSTETANNKFLIAPLKSDGDPLDSGTLRSVFSCKTKPCIQGVGFFKHLSQEYAIFSQSYGRRNEGLDTEKASKILVYKYNAFYNADFSGTPFKKIAMPVMIEQVYPYGSSVLFAIFESASKAFHVDDVTKDSSSDSKNMIDRVCALDLYNMIL